MLLEMVRPLLSSLRYRLPQIASIADMKDISDSYSKAPRKVFLVAELDGKVCCWGDEDAPCSAASVTKLAHPQVVGCAAVFPKTPSKAHPGSAPASGAKADADPPAPGPGEGEVGRVAVHRAYRGCGIAKRLMVELERRAKENLGYSSLFLMTASDGAKHLYRRMGYRVTGERRQGPSTTVLSFEKQLAVN